MPRYDLDPTLLGLTPDFDPMNVKDKFTTMSMNTANKPWNLANSGGGALGKPGSALGAPGSALRSNKPTLDYDLFSSALNPGGGTSNLAQQGTRFGLDLGSKSASNLGLQTQDPSKFSWGSIASAIPSMVLNSGAPQALFGNYAGNILSQGAGGAMTGAAIGGLPGAAIGGGIGAIGSALTGVPKKKPANIPMASADPNSFYL